MWTPRSAYDTARAAAAADAQRLQGMARFMLNTYRQQLPDRTPEQIGALLAQSNAQRLDAVPCLTTYPELRGMRRIVDANWRGRRDGAQLDDIQAAVLDDGLFHYHRVICAGRYEPKAHCSVAYFPTSDHGPLLAANLDTGLDEPFGVPPWPVTSEHLITGSVSSGVFMDEPSPEIFPAPIHQLVARYCRSTDEAVEMFTRYNHFWGPCNLLIADREHNVAMIEKTACRLGVRRSEDGFGFVTAMTAEHPDIATFLSDRRAASLDARGLTAPCADTRYWDAQDTRRGIMNRLMAEARANPTVEAMRAMMQYRGADGVVADNGDILHPGDPPIEHTLRTFIACLAEGRALWWARDNARNIPSWENPQPDAHYEDVWLWDDAKTAQAVGAS